MRKKKLIKAAILIASLLLLPLMFKEVAFAKTSAPDGMKKVCENESLALFIDEEETDIAVLDKASGKIWYSNPQDADEDSFASAYYKRFLKSQLQVTYFNKNVQSSTMDNYNDSIMNGQFEIEYTDDGVKINYYIGKAASMLTLPVLTFFLTVFGSFCCQKGTSFALKMIGYSAVQFHRSPRPG